VSVRAKLMLALAPLGVALALLGAVSVATISSLGLNATTILRDNYRSVLAMQRILNAIERLDDAETEDLLGIGAGSQAVTAQRKMLEAELEVEEGNITEDGEGASVSRLRADWQAYQAGLDRFLVAANAPEKRNLYLGDLQSKAASIRNVAEEVLAINQDAMVRKSEDAQRAAQRMNTLMVASSLGAFALGLVLSLGLLARVLLRLQVLTRAVQRIGEGDFAARVEVSGSDELAQLAASFNRMAERVDEYRRSSLGELLQAQEASQAAIDSIPDPVIVFGVEGYVLNTNRAAERILGFDNATAATHPLSHLDPPLRAAVERVLAHVLGGKGAYVPQGFEEAQRISTPDGEAYLLPRANPVYSEDGAISGATVILQDVTRLRRFDELKNDLVATAAHELRTPLTSLRMAIHLCVEEAAGPLNEKQADLLGAAREDCERLRATVDELLDLARLQGGGLELRYRAVAAASVVDAALEPLRPIARERGVKISVELPPFLPEIEVDPDRLQLVFANLLANAVRHSPPNGEVRVAAQQSGQSVRFEVRDQGEGIPAEHLAHVFEKFYQVPGSPAGSSGLGLSIAREIVTAHGGDIGAEANSSGDGAHGSLFWFVVPIRAAKKTSLARSHA
jgi:NtrC-family two-component system sensor histidine kinase KinB